MVESVLTLECTPEAILNVMSSGCCTPPAGHRSVALCPESGSVGTRVARRTVQALVIGASLQRLRSEEYRFCPDPTCDVVYFDDEGSRFTTADLRVPVWQKSVFGAGEICYCFGESEASIRAEVEAAGTSGAVDRIRRHIAANHCACDIRNPRGACCLGDVIAAVARVEAALASETQQAGVGIERGR